MSDLPFGKEDFEALSAFRYQVRRYLRWSELLTRRKGVTNLQYLLLLHIKGFPGRFETTFALVEDHDLTVTRVDHGAIRHRYDRLGRPGQYLDVGIHVGEQQSVRIGQFDAQPRGHCAWDG